MPQVAIVGTAGRNGPPLSARLFHQMVEEAIRVITETWRLDWHEVDLVSGGAAWADHVAVTLFLLPDIQPRSLTLHLPCAWKTDETAYLDTGVKNWKTNPGSSANLYHKRFSQAAGRDSLKDIAMAIHLGCQLHVHNGFHARNSFVAKADYLIAFTWGSSEPDDGGTLDTWKKCTSKNKVHVSLSHLQSPK